MCCDGSWDVAQSEVVLLVSERRRWKCEVDIEVMTKSNEVGLSRATKRQGSVSVAKFTRPLLDNEQSNYK